jgi:alpha-mannosidase
MKPYDDVTFSTPIASIIEEGPLRVTVTTQITVSVKDGPDSFSYSYIRTYSLSKGEPYLRLSVTGEAPDNTSIMMKFPFTNPVGAIVHGTPYHWDGGKMILYWEPPVFYPTQNFLIPITKDKQTLAALYHSGIPSWGYDKEGALIGNVLRNTPGGMCMYGADAADKGTHTQHFALRVPSGLGEPDTGQPLREALCFQTPIKACCVSELSGKTRPEKYSLASVAIKAGDTCPAVITSVKMAEDNPANLVMRLYQPTNQPLDVKVSLGLTEPAIVKARKVTALEAELKGEKDLALKNGTMSVTTNRALTTLLIETNTGLPG